MNKKMVIIFITTIIIVAVLLGIYFIIVKNKEEILKDNVNQNVDTLEELGNDDMSTTMKAIVIKVNENSLDVMECGAGKEGLCSVKFSEEGNIGFKRGQEVLIYFNGIIAASYPGQIFSVGKIEISKEESGFAIPDEVIRFYESSKDNVKVELKEITNSGISLIIIDTNELPYIYTNHKYKISKKVKNENYTGKGYKIGEDTEYTTSGYSGTGLEYVWEEVEVIGSVLSEDTEQPYDVSNLEGYENDKLIGRKFDWSELYGKLGERRI